ncbi:ORF17.5 [Felid gammaherpesvirus 1]|nr:ORF17.5 [Felis catus gammaherpesvirus 1]ALE14728.1 ORF17.5 [Felis catus gammaherpesvirus 1]
MATNARANTPTSDDLISIPRGAFMSLLQTNLDAKHPTTLHYPHIPSSDNGGQKMQFIPRQSMGYNASNIPYPSQIPPYYIPWQDMDPHGFNTMGFTTNHTYIPVPFPSRPNKRKRESDMEDWVTFPGEEIYRSKELQDLSKTITELQREIKELKNNSMGKIGVKTELQTVPPVNCQVIPQHGHYFPSQPFPPAYFHTQGNPLYPFYPPKNINTSNSPIINQGVVEQRNHESVPKSSENTKQSNTQLENKHEESGTSTQSKTTVDASMPPVSTVNPLQKLFCEELLKN